MNIPILTVAALLALASMAPGETPDPITLETRVLRDRERITSGELIVSSRASGAIGEQRPDRIERSWRIIFDGKKYRSQEDLPAAHGPANADPL